MLSNYQSNVKIQVMDDISCPIHEWIKSGGIHVVQGGHSTSWPNPLLLPFGGFTTKNSLTMNDGNNSFFSKI